MDFNVKENNDIPFEQLEGIDNKFNYFKPDAKYDKIGWLINMHPASIINENKRRISVVDYYFIEPDGNRFKVAMHYKPYFYLMVKSEYIQEVVNYMNKRYADLIYDIEHIFKEELDNKPNHLVGETNSFLRIVFISVNDLIKFRSNIMPLLKKYKQKHILSAKHDKLSQFNQSILEAPNNKNMKKNIELDIFSCITDIREYDVPYYIRVSIDNKIFVGHWYLVKGIGGLNDYSPQILLMPNIEERPEIIILAYDIETTKSPLKFPDKNFDQIMMISYVIDGQGFLIVNRQTVSEDIEDFEYIPKPQFEGFFKVYNEPNEVYAIKKFIDHILLIKPHIIVTYNGDNFDWPFLIARAKICGIDISSEIGFFEDEQGDHQSRSCIHMDCLKWVKRDSYLPIGSQGLKAVAKIKLDYDPSEMDPEEMCLAAIKEPKVLAAYSVSDALATYHLYMKYIHSFILSLCTILPLCPDDVLRKGSGTLCEALLMVQAYHANIIYPNKHDNSLYAYTNDGHLLQQETYIGGHVEAIESGIFRSDIPLKFKIDGKYMEELIGNVKSIIKNSIENEENLQMSQITNFNEVCEKIEYCLKQIKKSNILFENPKIYHLDVAAMYPNIILTNRLQPYAIVNETICANCPHNQPSSDCQRSLNWVCRQEFLPANWSESQRILLQLENENFPVKLGNESDNMSGKSNVLHNVVRKPFHQLPRDEQASIEKRRLTEYCRKAYKKVKVSREENKASITCQRENSFYIDTIRAFRDRRYEFKRLVKACNTKLADLKANENVKGSQMKWDSIEEWENKKDLYDSLQLAHKCILNSFYGYVMRKGARWFSMEMAGIVCLIGSLIIKEARGIIEKIGRPLELDTDGIWCALPDSLPESVTLDTLMPKRPKIKISFIKALLNLMVREKFTNYQYQELSDPVHYKYEKKAENSIFFEVDGPYYAMILPSSKEEGKKIKKRYAVFNMDRSLAECKGFEVKRRGELPILKIFQTSVFEAFLNGRSLQEVYKAVADVANYWLDFLYNKGAYMSESEIFELISENRNMSKRLNEYGERKSASVTTAKRLAEFLGDRMVQDKGLNCKYVIMKKPEGSPVTERAIPCAIFQADEKIKYHYLKKWLKFSNHNLQNSLNTYDKSNCKDQQITNNAENVGNLLVNFLDWTYYIERMESAIQKIITIPAAMQEIKNPVRRVAHPEWLHKKLLAKDDVLRQNKIDDIFKKVTVAEEKAALNFSVTSLNKKSRSSAWKQILGPAPSLKFYGENNFKSWLLYHKQKWRMQLNNRRQMPPNSLDETRLIKQVILSSKNPNNIWNCPWQVIQIRELPSNPGFFKIWVLVNTTMTSLMIKVPRIFYINYYALKTDLIHSKIHTKVSKSLPRGQIAYNLFRCEMPEKLFMSNYQKLLREFVSPNVEGIYETLLPLEYRLCLDYGCVWDLGMKSAKDPGKDYIQMDFNTMNVKKPLISKLRSSYLSPGSINYVYLYHCTQSKVELWSLALPTKKIVYVYYLAQTVGQLSIAQSSNIYNRERMALLQNEEKLNAEVSGETDVIPLPDHKFEILYVVPNGSKSASVKRDGMKITTGGFEKIRRSIITIMQELKDSENSNILVALQISDTTSEKTKFIESIPFPYVRITLDLQPFCSDDVEIFLFTHMCEQYLKSTQKLDCLLEHARYIDAPIGNLYPDPFLLGCDLIYGRKLEKYGHLLWASPLDKSDFGGKENDDYLSCIYEVDTTLSDSKSSEINNSGFYTNICVEIELKGICITALLQYHQILNAEGTCAGLGFNAHIDESSNKPYNKSSLTTGIFYDELVINSETFKLLKSIIHDWIKDLAGEDSLCADNQLINFYRWLISPSSILYDSCMKIAVQRLINKTFNLLIAELMNYGTKIIYADSNKLIICTNKSDVCQSLSYISYIINLFESHKMFHGINFSVVNVWNILLWYGPCNYGGIKAKLTSSVFQNHQPFLEVLFKEFNNAISHEVTQENLIMEWRFAKSIPTDGNCRRYFHVIIASYIKSVHSYLMQNRNTDKLLCSYDNNITEYHKDMTDVSPELLTFCQNLISNDIAAKMFEIIQKVHDLESTSKSKANEHYHSNTALHLALSICHILNLDSNIISQVATLKSHLLTILNIGQFSDDALYVNGLMEFKLKEVICEHCYFSNNLEIFDTYNGHNTKLVCKCSNCGYLFKKDYIETLLITLVKGKLLRRCLQDLICQNCHQVKETNIADRCLCGGVFTFIDSQTELSLILSKIKTMAFDLKMELLENVLDCVL